MNGVRNYASITHSSCSPTATTRPTSPTPADGPTPAVSSPPSPASSAPHPAATEPVTSTAPPHDLAASRSAVDKQRAAGPDAELVERARGRLDGGRQRGSALEAERRRD